MDNNPVSSSQNEHEASCLQAFEDLQKQTRLSQRFLDFHNLLTEYILFEAQHLARFDDLITLSPADAVSFTTKHMRTLRSLFSDNSLAYQSSRIHNYSLLFDTRNAMERNLHYINTYCQDIPLDQEVMDNARALLPDLKTAGNDMEDNLEHELDDKENEDFFESVINPALESLADLSGEAVDFTTWAIGGALGALSSWTLQRQ
jgi:hypothetical protein